MPTLMSGQKSPTLACKYYDRPTPPKLPMYWGSEEAVHPETPEEAFALAERLVSDPKLWYVHADPGRPNEFGQYRRSISSLQRKKAGKLIDEFDPPGLSLPEKIRLLVFDLDEWGWPAGTNANTPPYQVAAALCARLFQVLKRPACSAVVAFSGSHKIKGCKAKILLLTDRPITWEAVGNLYDRAGADRSMLNPVSVAYFAPPILPEDRADPMPKRHRVVYVPGEMDFLESAPREGDTAKETWKRLHTLYTRLSNLDPGQPRHPEVNKAAFQAAGVAAGEGAPVDIVVDFLTAAVQSIPLFAGRDFGDEIKRAAEDGYRRPLDSAPIDLIELTDTGNARVFAGFLEGRARFCHARRSWVVWDGRLWKWDDRGCVVELAKRCLRERLRGSFDESDDERGRRIRKHVLASESAARIRAMISLTESEPGIPVALDDLDSDPDLLGCENGTLDLKTGELRAADPLDLITRSVAAAFDPAACSNLWDECLAAWFGADAEKREYVARVAGYCLGGRSAEKAFWFFFGPADGGKSAFLNALRRTWGGYAVAVDASTWAARREIGGNRGDLVRLAGVRLAVTSEFRAGARFDEEILKRSTGGDEITAAAKFENEVQFSPHFKVVLAGNDAPRIRDDDSGLWSRVRRFPMENAIPPGARDPLLSEKLDAGETRAAILAWAYSGYRQYLAEGLGTCSAVEKSTADYSAEMDRVAGFLEDEAEFSPSAAVSAADLRDRYMAWARRNAVYPLSGKDFAARLKKHGAEPGKSGSQRIWRGVRLAERVSGGLPAEGGFDF